MAVAAHRPARWTHCGTTIRTEPALDRPAGRRLAVAAVAVALVAALAWRGARRPDRPAARPTADPVAAPATEAAATFAAITGAAATRAAAPRPTAPGPRPATPTLPAPLAATATALAAALRADGDARPALPTPPDPAAGPALAAPTATTDAAALAAYVAAAADAVATVEAAAGALRSALAPALDDPDRLCAPGGGAAEALRAATRPLEDGAVLADLAVHAPPPGEAAAVHQRLVDAARALMRTGAMLDAACRPGPMGGGVELVGPTDSAATGAAAAALRAQLASDAFRRLAARVRAR